MKIPEWVKDNGVNILVAAAFAFLFFAMLFLSK